jgi:hypothetical protein
MIHVLAGALAAPTETASTAPLPPPHHITLSWMALGILAACIITWLVFRWRNAGLNGRHNSPRKLWRDLARLHQLSWTDRRLLSQAARKIKLREPARLFLEPELWRQALEAENHGRRLKRLSTLQKRLLKD